MDNLIKELENSLQLRQQDIIDSFNKRFEASIMQPSVEDFRNLHIAILEDPILAITKKHLINAHSMQPRVILLDKYPSPPIKRLLIDAS
jgi:hypothetical protein